MVSKATLLHAESGGQGLLTESGGYQAFLHPQPRTIAQPWRNTLVSERPEIPVTIETIWEIVTAIIPFAVTITGIR